ncbi:MAG: polysaccharide biosynthesis C-terminal domain-containing protein [Defluviitaleaceae bacterium]|nr:polysaccharide biosynthesis C-terminal domain-containing protein [Defluviitaleaceae bacterium]
MATSKNTPNRNASDAAIISLGGRFLTFIANTLNIGRFGTANPLFNAFTFALLLPTVIFTVLGAALNAVMIPVYNSLLAEEKTGEAKKFIDNVISISLVLLGIMVTAGIIAAPWISSFLEGGDFENPEYLTFALRVLLPTMIFFGFGAIFTGLLQSHGVFRTPAFVTAPGGIILIIYVVFFSDRFGVDGLVFAAFLGFLSQPLIMIPAVKKLGYRYKFSLNLKNKNIRDAGKLCIPVLISAASYNMHFIFGNSIALRFNTTAVMNYSQQIVMVFILTIVYAIAGVYFPRLSVLWAKSNLRDYNETFRNALQYTFFLILPASLGIFLMRFEIMDFLLNWRGNEPADIQMAGNLMGIYAIGAIAISFKEVADRAFYSEKDSKTPAVFGVLIMATNIITTLLLIPAFGTYAMPIAYALAAIIGSGGISLWLNRKIKFINFKFLLELLKTSIAAAAMLFFALVARNQHFTENRLINLIIPALVGAIVYFAIAYLLRISVLGRDVK